MTKFVAALLTLTLVGAGCGDDDSAAEPPADPTPTEVAATPTEPPADPTPTDPEPPTQVDWDDPSVRVDLGDGWSIGACEGDGPFLCVSSGSEHVAGLEASFFDTSTLALFDPDAGVAENLGAIAGDFHESFRADRAAGCGDGYGFEPIEFAPATVGGLEGGTFGFVGTNADGSPSEMDLHWATVVDDHVMMVVAAAFDPGGCLAPDEGGSFETSELRDLRSELDRVLADSPLPQRPV